MISEKKTKRNKLNLLRNKYTFAQKIYSLFIFGTIIKFIYRFCTVLSSQAVLVFIFAPINYLLCLCVLCYFLFVVTFNLIKIFYQINFFTIYE